MNVVNTHALPVELYADFETLGFPLLLLCRTSRPKIWEQDNLADPPGTILLALQPGFAVTLLVYLSRAMVLVRLFAKSSTGDVGLKPRRWVTEFQSSGSDLHHELRK